MTLTVPLLPAPASSGRSSSPLHHLASSAPRPRLPLAHCGVRTQRRLFLALLLIGSLLLAGLWIRSKSAELSDEAGERLAGPLSSEERRPVRAQLVPRTDVCSVPPSQSGSPRMQEGPEGEEGDLPPAGHLNNRPRVLLIPKTSYSNAHKAVSEILVANRIK